MLRSESLRNPLTTSRGSRYLQIMTTNQNTDMNTDITDITWAQLSDAGIDTDLVTRQHDALGGENYVLRAGDVMVVFGPAIDMENGGTWGWDLCVWETDGEDWDETRQDWHGTADELLLAVAAAAVPDAR
jgi:hypothetical protein